MLKRFNRLIVLLLVVAATLYVAYLNQEVITIRLLPKSPFTAQVGIVIICTFAIGMLVMSLFMLWMGLQSYIRERAVNSRERERQQFYQNVINARSFLAAGENGKARHLWEQAIRRDPTHIIARVELSKSIQAAGDSPAQLLEALRVLDEARAKEPKNIEVLFRAAELNLALNNKTSALDNLALIIYERPVKRALVMAREISADLERYEDALEYNKKLQAIGEDDPAIFAKLKFKRLVHEFRDNPSKLHDELRIFLKKNPNHSEALQKLAESELRAGKNDEAAQLFARASKSSGDKKTWQKAARIWVKNNTPEKAIAAARSIANDSRGIRRVHAEIELIRLFIALSMLQEAKKHCDSFMSVVRAEETPLTDEIKREFLALKGVCYLRLGENKIAEETLKMLCSEDAALDEVVNDDVLSPPVAPAPRLSTP